MKKSTKQANQTKARKTSSPKRVAKAGKTKPAKTTATKRAHLILPAGTRADRKEAEHFVKTLKANKQLYQGSGILPPGATHKIETDESGAQHLVRKRYSAI
jgi:hypothetical protein